MTDTMIPDLLPSLIILGAVVLITVHQAIQWIARSRLPARIYLKHIYPRQMAAAYEKGDVRRAEQQVYQAYLDRLLDPNPTAHDIAVQYLEQLTATRELAQKLVEALPNQRRGDVQERLARLLRDTLHDLAKNEAAHPAGNHHPRPAWSWALTIWGTEAILITMGWFWLPQIPPDQFILVGLILAVATFLPLTWIVHQKRLLAQLAVFSTGIALAVLWSFSETAHTGIGITPRVALDTYGFRGIQMEITYPRWLTAEDVGDCTDRANKVTIFVFGTDQPQSDSIEISFKNDLARLIITNKDCASLGSRFVVSTSNSVGEPIDFYVRPTNREVLTEQSIRLMPLVRHPITASNSPTFPVGELAFDIKLEDPIWKAIRDICKIGAGVTTFPAFLSYVVDRMRKKDKG